MAETPVVQFLSLKKETPKRGYWDYGLLDDLLKEFQQIEVGHLEPVSFSIVVIPARHHADMVGQINDELSRLDSILLFLMGDEENDFPIDKIEHKNIKIWVQNPPRDLPDKYGKLGCGYPPAIHEYIELPDKKFNWFFSGQNTHERRELCLEQLKNLTEPDNHSMYNETKGFTQGLNPNDYYQGMANSKTAPCPSGPQTVDTFRIYEALELGCVPIADNLTPKEDWSGFWEWLFGEPVPFLTISDYDDLPGYIMDCKDRYPKLNNRVQAWWFRYKSRLQRQIYSDVEKLSSKNPQNPITVVIPISPIPSHPDIRILEETISSIRHHLPDSEIVLTFDGVRTEQKSMLPEYEEHIRRVLWKARTWGKVTPFIFDKHKHQSGMMKEVLEYINTPMLLYVEQDTPLVVDEPIEWELIESMILIGESNVIRLHHEGRIPKAHNHLMIDEVKGKFQKTYQWSQRPHLASTAFYRRIMNENFTDKANCFIEDLIHGRLQGAYIRDKKMGWDQWRVHIYIPDEKNIKRSYTTDGREGAKKYDEKQIW